MRDVEEISKQVSEIAEAMRAIIVTNVLVGRMQREVGVILLVRLASMHRLISEEFSMIADELEEYVKRFDKAKRQAEEG